MDKRLQELVDMHEQTVQRAIHVEAYEDAAVRNLCERIGYGAVIDSAARLWQHKDPVGAFTVGPCVGVLESLLEIPERSKLKNRLARG